jgi:hypothetical protein
MFYVKQKRKHFPSLNKSLKMDESKCPLPLLLPKTSKWENILHFGVF